MKNTINRHEYLENAPAGATASTFNQVYGTQVQWRKQADGTWSGYARTRYGIKRFSTTSEKLAEKLDNL